MMLWLKEIGAICVALTLSGCTVLGFATDLALSSAVNDSSRQQNLNNVDHHRLFFTKKGLAQDVKAIESLLEEIAQSNPHYPSVLEEHRKAQLLACQSVENGKQPCYPAEYYRDIYITSPVSQGDKTGSANE